MANYNLLDVPDQYFVVYDRDRHNAITDSIIFLNQLGEADSDDQEKMLELKEKITPVFGFREAENILDVNFGFDHIIDYLKEKEHRQIDLKIYLERKIEDAARRAAANYPSDFKKIEIKRDAVFYTAARSGLSAIAEVIGQKVDWENTAGEICSGTRLDKFLSPSLVEDVIGFLPYAILFNGHRDELKQRLQHYGIKERHAVAVVEKLPKQVELLGLNLSSEQMKSVENLIKACAVDQRGFDKEFDLLVENHRIDKGKAKSLKRRLERVVKGSTFLLAKSLSGLKRGVVSEDVLSRAYTRDRACHFYALGAKLSQLGLKTYDIDHVHTDNARYMDIIYSTYLPGNGIPQVVIKELGIEDISSWYTYSNSIPLLDPKTQIDSITLGLYIGLFLFGWGHSKTGELHYYSTKRKQDSLISLLERTGKLSRKPGVSKTLANTQEGTKIQEYSAIPVQFGHLAKYGLEKGSQDRELAIAALRVLFEDKATGYASQYSDSRTLWIDVKPEYADVIKEMAKLTGITLTPSSASASRIHASVKDPELVGYIPEFSLY